MTYTGGLEEEPRANKHYSYSHTKQPQNMILIIFVTLFCVFTDNQVGFFSSVSLTADPHAVLDGKHPF